MRKIISFVVVFLCFLTISVLNAQPQWTKEEKQLYKQRLEDAVNDFNGRVSEIWRRPNKVESQNMEEFRAAKEAYIHETLKLFIGEGKPYEELLTIQHWNGNEYEEIVDKVQHRAAIMETSSMSSSIITKQTVESYLRKAAMGMGSRVEVSSYDAYIASDLKEVAPGQYEATMAYIQDFNKYDQEGKKVCSERTTKTIRVLMTPQYIGGEVVAPVKLGDIRVVETQRL